MSGRLIWTGAVNGALRKMPEDSQDLVASGTRRLREELEKGALPMISLDFLDEMSSSIERLSHRLRRYKHLLLLGIGGSALGPRALQKAFAPGQDGPGHDGPCLWVMDNINTERLEAWLSRLPAEDALVLCISKSGGTIETMAQFFLVRDRLMRELGPSHASRIITISDPKPNLLRREAEENDYLALPVPEALGGRYSVISLVGMLPAAFLGIDWREFLKGVQSVTEPLATAPETLAAHPAWRMSRWAKALMDAGCGQLVFFNYVPAWSAFGDWFAQLWAESLGKEGKGSMPVSATGVTDQHSLLQMFLDGPKDKGCLFVTCPKLPRGPAFHAPLPAEFAFLEHQRLGDLLRAEALGTAMALEASGMPLLRFEAERADERGAGELMALCMLMTLFTGWRMDVNPLDQPAVELGKRLAKARLGADGLEKEKEALNRFLAKKDEVVELGEWRKK